MFMKLSNQTLQNVKLFSVYSAVSQNREDMININWTQMLYNQARTSSDMTVIQTRETREGQSAYLAVALSVLSVVLGLLTWITIDIVTNTDRYL